MERVVSIGSGLLFWIISLCMVLQTTVEVAHGQSCGPRVSARLLAEIPCDMSETGYCGSPGSAYPWSSVKRYINDNQGLVRRMYGDEKHSAVLLNEIDTFRLRFDTLNSRTYGSSRATYGRSAKSSRRSPTRRQPRPQIFTDDPEDTNSAPTTYDAPATIFRVVTETSIKVGDAPTNPSVTTPGETIVLYEPASEYESTTPPVDGDPTSTESTPESVTTVPVTDETTSQDGVTTEEYDVTQTASEANDAPIAMERIGYGDYELEEEPLSRRKVNVVLDNSVEDKTKHKQHLSEKEAENVDHKHFQLEEDEKQMANEEEAITEDDLVADETQENSKRNQNDETSDAEEEVPRRGINACPVKNEVIAPYWANNTRGETLALLNVHPFEQYVHFEKCAFENHQMLCREGCRCEQQYRLHRLLAFDPKNECRGIFSDWFRFPSCCVCICYDLTPDIPLARGRKGRMK